MSRREMKDLIEDLKDTKKKPDVDEEKKVPPKETKKK